MLGQVRWAQNIDVGNLVRIDGYDVGLQVTAQPNPRWDLNFKATRYLSYEADERFYFTNLLFAKVSHHFNRRHHLRFVGQYGRADLNADLLGSAPLEWNADLVAQLVYRYELNARTAVHAGFSLFGAEDNLIGEPRGSRRFGFLKVTYHF